MRYHAKQKQNDMVDALNSTSTHVDDLLNIDNIYFEQMIHRIYPAELQLNKANSSDTEVPFLNLNLSKSDGIVSTKIYRGYSNFLLNMAFISPSEVKNIYIS